MGSMVGQLQRESVKAICMAWYRMGDGEQRTGDLVSRTAFARRDKNQELHDAIIDLRTARLDNEDILLSNAGEDLDARLALG
jgi:predicted Abi (CAAX) family protease